MENKIKVGAKVPNFKLPVSDEEEISPEDFKGKNLLIYFYPKDDTPGCTLEAKDFRDHSKEFEKLNTVIIGISKDDLKSHDKFSQKCKLPFKLASDANSDVCEKFGVWQQKSFMGKKYMGIVRSTFLIDDKGVVKKIWEDVTALGHAKAVLAEIKKG